MTCEISLKKINDEIVTPFKISGGADTRPVKGEKLFSEVYSNIFLCARKKSGKTVVIQKIIKECVGKNTTVLAFCSTVNKDSNWIAIKKWCAKHKIPFEGFSSIREHKLDFLDSFIHRLEEEAEEEQLDPDEESGSDLDEPVQRMKSHATSGKYSQGGKKKQLNFFGGKHQKQDYDSAESELSSADEGDNFFGGGNDDIQHDMAQRKLFDKKPKTSMIKKEPYQSPEYLMVFDDLSHELKLPSLVSLLKKNRHYKLKVILSSQYLNDLKPESCRQMDYVLLFKGQSDDKLAKVIKDCDIAIDLPTLKKIYDDATTPEFGFLYIDVRNDQFRRNFDKMYLISKPCLANEENLD